MMRVVESSEPVLDPGVPIVDVHHHLWVLGDADPWADELADERFSRGWSRMFRERGRYLLDEFLADARTGHDIRATVVVGDVETATVVAAECDRRREGIRVGAAIVGSADLSQGARVEEELLRQADLADGRYRGIRDGVPGRLTEPEFLDGARRLAALGLSLEIFLPAPHLAEAAQLARTLPELTIVLDHAGVPVRGDDGTEDDRIWTEGVRVAAAEPNILMKLGGLGSTGLPRMPSYDASPPASSERLAEEWRPYILGCIDAFGPDRCMFESDYPPGSMTASYRTTWNTFARIVADASPGEKRALFSGTATRAYRLEGIG
jgi:predicted TIM-barrel fold metal-dependent hydrolase